MILAGNVTAIVVEELDGLIDAAMTELEFESLCSERARDQLMSEANAEDWFFVEQDFDLLGDRINVGRIAGTVRQEDQIGLEFQAIFG